MASLLVLTVGAMFVRGDAILDRIAPQRQFFRRGPSAAAAGPHVCEPTMPVAPYVLQSCQSPIDTMLRITPRQRRRVPEFVIASSYPSSPQLVRLPTDFVSAVLRQCGASVGTALSADEAMKELNRESYDLLITDVAMPGEDGISLVRRVASTIKPRPIAMTLMATDDTYPGDDIGFRRVLRKPIDPLDLARAVAEALE